MARNPKQDANLAPPFTSEQSREEASKNGRLGGIKSGEVRRARRDAKAAIQYLLGLEAQGALKNNLEKLGYEEGEMTNMAAVQARMFTSAMSGDVNAYIQLMRLGGYEPEENRRERESLASDRRRERELEAKIEAIQGNAVASAAMSNEDGNNDVLIYLPENRRDNPLGDSDAAVDGSKQGE